MDEGFSSPTGINWQGQVGVVEYGGGDRNQVVMFYNKPVHNPAKSATAGRPFYEDQVFVRIHPPGERLNIVDCPATGVHARKYPTQWQQFRQQKQQTPEGTPIDMLYPDHPSIGATLRASNVFTVEQCAELSASAIETIGMGAQTYVNTAKNYLSAANKGVKATEFRKTVEDLEQKNKILERQVEQLKAQLDKVIDNRLTGQQGAEQLQTLLAGLMGRPQHLPQTGFDPAIAQINATHGSAVNKPRDARQRVRARSVG